MPRNRTLAIVTIARSYSAEVVHALVWEERPGDAWNALEAQRRSEDTLDPVQFACDLPNSPWACMPVDRVDARKLHRAIERNDLLQTEFTLRGTRTAERAVALHTRYHVLLTEIAEEASEVTANRWSGEFWKPMQKTALDALARSA